MSKKSQAVFLTLLALLLIGVVFYPARKPKKPKVHVPLKTGTEVKEGDHVYADGRISLAAGLSYKNLSRNAVLVITARPVGQSGGAPMASKQFTPHAFPFRLFLTTGDNTDPKTGFYEDDILVTARVTEPEVLGKAMSGDWEGSAVVKKNSKRLVEIVLKPVQPAS